MKQATVALGTCLFLALLGTSCGGGGGSQPVELVLETVEPPFGPAAGGTQLLFRGRGFASGELHVYFGETPALQLEVVDDSTLLCASPALLPGAVTIRLETAFGRTTLDRAFHYLRERLEGYDCVTHGGVADGYGLGAASWGRMAFDAVDLLRYGRHDAVVGGTPSGPHYDVALPYSIDAERTLRWMDGSDTVNEGAITSDDLVAGLSSVWPGDVPSVALLTHRHDTLTAVELSGEYHLGVFAFESHAPAVWWGKVRFDGAGRSETWRGGNIWSIAGPPPVDPAEGSYTVTDGTVAFVPFGDIPDLVLRGGALPGGELVALAGGAGPMGTYREWEVLMVLLPVTTTPVIPVLGDSYHVVGIHAEDVADRYHWTSLKGTGTVHVTSTLDFEDLTLNEDGDVSVVATWAEFLWTPHPGGRLTATRTDTGQGHEGGVSPDGRFAFLVGGTDHFDPLSFYFLYR